VVSTRYTFRHALDVLRAGTGPLTVREMVEPMLKAKGITATAKQRGGIEAGVRASLANHAGKTVEFNKRRSSQTLAAQAIIRSAHETMRPKAPIAPSIPWIGAISFRTAMPLAVGIWIGLLVGAALGVGTLYAGLYFWNWYKYRDEYYREPP
jgi:hypothetical protein